MRKFAAAILVTCIFCLTIIGCSNEVETIVINDMAANATAGANIEDGSYGQGSISEYAKPTDTISTEAAGNTVEPTLVPENTVVPTEAPKNEIVFDEMDEVEGYVNKDGVNFRTEADTSSTVLGIMMLGKSVAIIGKGGDWYKVKIGCLVGYMAKEFVSVGTYSTPAPTSTPHEKAAAAPTNTPKPTAKPTPKPTNTPKPTAKPTPKPTKTPKPTAKPTPKPTKTPNPTPKPTKTPKPTATPTPKPTKTPKPTTAPTPTPSPFYTVAPGQFSDSDVLLLAKFLTYEARYNNTAGQRAVGSVVLNRVLNESGHFPDTVRGVLFQKNQFCSEAALANITPTNAAKSNARYILQDCGATIPKKVLFYRAASLGTTWESYMSYYDTIDGNSFFYGTNGF
ncbi:MAG: cell wall hydrolase [Clostridia bacterium]|nr:cell wall hydrolase [Clostridia bacterium]